ncbi:MAG: TRAP transporter permease [Candidatus Aminicenantes bacterium]|nr:TRAP transporter permease [Candidatus Aminicenantes bacterium]
MPADKNPKIQNILTWFAAGVALFHIWANTFGNLNDLWRNALHLGLLGFLGFLTYSWSKKKPPSKVSRHVDIFFGGLLLVSSGYLIFFENALHKRNEVPVLADLLFAGIVIVLALELTRRTSGIVIPILAIIFLTYVLWWGQFVGGVFGLRNMSLSRVLYRMYFTDEGLFGMIATISSTYVFMFILFASFLLKSGAGDFIIRLSRSVTRRFTGGPGLVAIVASGFMGTISGSAVANTVSTGSITIPVMKKAGYPAKFAAAIETASSTGGQLMPPIMGAGAFIMAQWTQIPYVVIIGAALLPALLYFASVIFAVFLEVKKQGIQSPAVEDIEPVGRILREGVHFLFPISVLITLLIVGFTPTFVAGISILAVIAASWIRQENRMGFRAILEALAVGTKNMMATGVLLVTVGIVVGTINMTGVSISFSQLVVQWAGSSLLLALLLITIASLLLGMGLPVTAAYVMIAILAVPALTEMGVGLLAAHMIIFWLSQDSNVTPPVCLAAFAASSIAGSRPMATGFASWKLAKGLYILPVLFAYTSLISGTWGERFLVFGFALFGLFAFAAFMTRYFFRPLSIVERILLIPCAHFLFWPKPIWINFAGLALFTGIGFHNKYSKNH